MKIQNKIPNVVSFSGGRTSAYLVHVMEQERKRRKNDIEIEYIYMDTGAEHPKTYEFIRNVVNHFKINLTCIRTVVSPEKGVGVKYKIVSLSECKPDLQPWREMMAKYGTLYIHGAFCTDRMKTTPFNKYCKDTYPDGYLGWLGIRIDEPKRLKSREGYKYLADISHYEKEDILNWWENQTFDLEIEEHLGNCVFCIKKGVNKVALAVKDEPELYSQFKDAIYSESVNKTESRKLPSNLMYRGDLSIDGVAKLYSSHSRDDILSTIRGQKRYSSGSCTESCEVFGCQLDMFKE